MSEQINVVFPVNGFICQATITPFNTVYTFAGRDKRGWDWRCAKGRGLSLNRAFLGVRDSGKYALVPWSEIGTINLQGAAVVDQPLDFEPWTQADTEAANARAREGL